MKTQVFRIALLVMTLVVVRAAVAQSQPGDILVNIPFSFLVGNHHLPPGSYLVARAPNGSLRISRTEDRSSCLFVTVHSVESRVSQPPKVVFHRYADTYFLTEVWNGEGRIGRQLLRSKAEQELASAKVKGSHVSGEVAEVRPER
jgi:hypothetical protein